jgi:serine/threonine protein kinase
MTQELDPQIYNSAIIKVRHAIHEITAATAASMEKKNRGRKRSLSLPDYLMVDSERMFKYVGYKPKIGWKLNDTAQLAQECGKAALKMKDNNKSLYYNLGLINEGSNSLIYRCVNTQGENYIHKCYCSKFGTDRRRREVNMLLSFAHPCIIRVGGYGHPSPDSEIPDVFCFKALQSDDEGIYISGFTMPEGVPLNVLNSHGILSEIKIAAYLADICNALSYIHSLKVVHLDVKPHNIIVTTTGAKLADFDGCVMAGAGPRWMKKMGVNYTTLYTSPEMLSTKKKITPSHDAWSIGVTLTYLLRHSHPHLGDLTKIEATYSLASLHKLLLSIYRSKVMPDVSNKTYGKKYSNILRRIFVYEPNLRWSCDQIREALRRMF